MAAPKYTQMGFTVLPEERARLAKYAKDTDDSKLGVLRKALDLYMSFPPEFLAVLKKAAKQMDLPLSTVIINMLIKRIAVDSAFLKVFGEGAAKGLMNEFRIEEGKLLTADELADTLEDEYFDKFQKLKENLIKTAEAKNDSEKPVISTDDFREFFSCTG